MKSKSYPEAQVAPATIEPSMKTMEDTMSDTELHQQLDALSEKLSGAQTQLKQKAELFHDIEHLTARQLQERHDLLKAKIDAEVGDLKEQGHHVNNFEKSVIGWIDSLEF